MAAVTTDDGDFWDSRDLYDAGPELLQHEWDLVVVRLPDGTEYGIVDFTHTDGVFTFDVEKRSG